MNDSDSDEDFVDAYSEIPTSVSYESSFNAKQFSNWLNLRGFSNEVCHHLEGM